MFLLLEIGSFSKITEPLLHVFCDWLLLLERSLLLAELEKEEKEKDWYYAQLQNLTKRIDSLPLTENVSALVKCITVVSVKSMLGTAVDDMSVGISSLCRQT